MRIGRKTMRRLPAASSTSQRIFAPRTVCCDEQLAASQPKVKSTPPAPLSLMLRPDAAMSSPRRH
jgi:hypothetical protein